MKVYKFGGASVRNAEGVRNLQHIVEGEENLFIVVSAMGKTTNALERVFTHLQKAEKAEAHAEIDALVAYHYDIINPLWGEEHPIEEVDALFAELREIVDKTVYRSQDAELWYDRVVAYGELISTTIISKYLKHSGIRNRWIDMRECFVTSSRHKDANVDIKASKLKLRAALENTGVTVFVGQGFIGATPDGEVTTLGREGSDYSAAVVANIMQAESMSVWKDVDGVLNADPKIFKDAVKIDALNYLDTIELAYSGAQIIHPKTIKPLQNKNIPLYVKCFVDPSKEGSVIKESIAKPIDVPILILKKNQTLLSIKPTDYSFILEERMAQIFKTLESHRAKVNLVQNSAISMALCIDKCRYLDEIVEDFHSQGFEVKYNTDMELLTIRGYTKAQLKEFAEAEGVYMTQRSRKVLRILRKL